MDLKTVPDESDPVNVLAKVGGLDIAGLCGVFLGGALYRVPVLLDGWCWTRWRKNR